jgi:predicted nucleic acid-binding protein
MKLNSMSCNYIIDAYAWIEYFKASKMGEAAREFIESEHSVTPTIVVSEISRKLRRDVELGNETQEGRLQRLEFIRATSRVVDLDFETAVEAGSLSEDLKIEAKGWGLADSIVLCTARKLKGKVITGDEHFRHLDNVIFIKP